jgi:hypothetical protein
MPAIKPLPALKTEQQEDDPLSTIREKRALKRSTP